MGVPSSNDKIVLPYGDQELTATLPAGKLLGVFSPNPATPATDVRAELRRALGAPIGVPPLRSAARGASSVVIIVDDLTRRTPSDLIVPELLEDLNAANIRDEQVTVLIALGTHRAMTEDEIIRQYGREITNRVEVVNHPWEDLSQLVDLGVTPNGTPISVCRIAKEADFLIGVGSVVPHHIAGFSGGAKIVQPGISSFETTGATHLLSARPDRSYLGRPDNPVREEMETIGDRTGLNAVFNCVLDGSGRLVRGFYGDPRQAFRAAMALSRDVYSVEIPTQTDIVVAGSHPCDIEFWQAHKTLYSAELVVKKGGTMIVVTPCPEGVTVTHQEMLNYTSLEPEEIEARIEDGTITDRVSGAAALVWAKVRRHADIYLVSNGIPDTDAGALGFTPFSCLDDAIGAALKRHGSDASVCALTQSPETLPILAS